MDILYAEVHDYLKVYLPDNNLTLDSVIPLVNNYSDYTKKLIPDSAPNNLHKYINIPLMIHDLHQDGDILIFCFDAHDDDESIYSDIDYDLPEHTQGFINGVKMLDESDIREQITANEYTGGYWDERIHWVVDLKKLTESAPTL